MKRFLVFETPEYYPGGGLHDLKALCDTLDEAKVAVRTHYPLHILDTQTGETLSRESDLERWRPGIVEGYLPGA
jgi:hypothetical protein